MNNKKTIAFFPEGAFGPALNSVGIAQACRDLGHRCVFLTDPGFAEVYEGYGFEYRIVNLSEPMSAEEMANYWSNFIDGHIPNFNLTPYEQIDNYVKECWEAIVDTAKWAEKDLPGVLDGTQTGLDLPSTTLCYSRQPSSLAYLGCESFLAVKTRFPTRGFHHICQVAVNQTESVSRSIKIDSTTSSNRFTTISMTSFNLAVNPHIRSVSFLKPLRHMNLLLYPEPVKYERKNALDPAQFQYLEGCVRSEESYEIPEFAGNKGQPLVYLSFGSLGSGDTDLLNRIIEVLGRTEYRVLANVGDYIESYGTMPDNVHIDSWYPQPSVIEQADAVIHHGGNNSFNECLYFGKPAIIMPYVWDGHDNSTRVQEAGCGLKMHRSNWTEEEFLDALETLLTDKAMLTRLSEISRHMQAADGTTQGRQNHRSDTGFLIVSQWEGVTGSLFRVERIHRCLLRRLRRSAGLLRLGPQRRHPF